jgi:hypothetical protein
VSPLLSFGGGICRSPFLPVSVSLAILVQRLGAKRAAWNADERPTRVLQIATFDALVIMCRPRVVRLCRSADRPTWGDFAIAGAGGLTIANVPR